MIDRETLARVIIADAGGDYPMKLALKRADEDIAAKAAMGLAIVPIEATERMIEAADAEEDSHLWRMAYPQEIWSAMLKAAGERG